MLKINNEKYGNKEKNGYHKDNSSYEKKQHIKEKKYCMNAKELFCEKRGAVVTVTAETILIIGTQLPANPVSNSRVDLKVTGNGFFVCENAGKFQNKKCKDCKCGKRKRYIVCPASVVLINPCVTSVALRYPFVENPPTPTNSRIKNVVLRASTFRVTVPNVNCEGKTFIYDAELVGVSGSDDIALLKIKEECCPSLSQNNNKCGPPKIKKCHPFFEFNEDCLKIGDKVFLIGSYTTEMFDNTETVTNPQIVEGTVVKPRFTDPEGNILPELLLVNAEVYSKNVGLPIIDCCGEVVAMQTTNVVGVDGTALVQRNLQPNFVLFDLTAQGNGAVAGPIAEVLVCNIHKILSSLCLNKTCCVWTETIVDDGGNFVRVLKSYLGLAYKLVMPYMYNTTSDFTSGLAPTVGSSQYLTDSNGIVTSIANQDLLITGIYTMGIAGINPDDLSGIDNGRYYVPGGTTGQSSGPLSPTGDENNLGPSNLLGTPIIPGAMIRRICYHKVGNNCDERAPSYILMCVKVGNTVEIEYLTGGNFIAYGTDLTKQYVNCNKINVVTKSMPPLMDYPWGTDLFPKIETHAVVTYPQILVPVAQESDLQLPERVIALLIAGFFKPAI